MHKVVLFAQHNIDVSSNLLVSVSQNKFTVYIKERLIRYAHFAFRFQFLSEAGWTSMISSSALVYVRPYSS